MPEFILRTAFEIGAKNFARVAKLGGRWCIGLLKWSELIVGWIHTSVPWCWCEEVCIVFIWELAIDRYFRVGSCKVEVYWEEIFISKMVIMSYIGIMKKYEWESLKFQAESYWVTQCSKIFDIFRWILEKIYWTFTVWQMDFWNNCTNLNIMKLNRYV